MVDDIDGTPFGEDGESIHYAVDGVEYVTDLKDEHAKELRETFEYYIAHSTRVGGRKHRADRPVNPTAAKRPARCLLALHADRGVRPTRLGRPPLASGRRRLDGLPLAIELAAARLRALSPEQILQRLSDGFALLAPGGRGAPTRQQTLRLCIDWSYELCTSTERRLWAQLSVFAGSVELDAAEGVCRCDAEMGELLDVLTALVDKSILIREESGAAVRFRMLGALGDYGREKGRESGELADLRRRHRDWYRQLAFDADAGWISARQLDWIARMDREHSNLQGAQDLRPHRGC